MYGIISITITATATVITVSSFNFLLNTTNCKKYNTRNAPSNKSTFARFASIIF